MRLTMTSVAAQTTTSSQDRADEGETVAYSGPYLAELMASGEMSALAEVDVEQTVVLAGSPMANAYAPNPRDYEHTAASSITIAPVAYSCSQPFIAPPSKKGIAPPLAAGLVVVGMVFGLVAQISLSTDAHAARTVVPRQPQARESIDEKTPLVALTRSKVAAKRHLRPSTSANRVSTAAAPAHAETAETMSDEDLIRAAQLERSL